MSIKDMSADVVADTKHIFKQPQQIVNERQWQPPIAAPYHRSVYIAAQMTHETNKAYCESIGDFSQVSWVQAPDWQKESALKGVDAVRNNPSITPEQLHEGWSQVKRAEGWTYGPTKEPEAKRHPCLVPYHELPQEQRVKDTLFRCVAIAVLRREGGL